MPVSPAHPSLQAELQAMQLPRLGGDLCLDFVNTAEYRGAPGHVEFLTSAQRLLAWLRHAGVLDEAEWRRHAAAARRDTALARELLARALRLRESLWRVFSAQVAGATPPPAVLRPLNEALAALGHQRRLAAGEAGIGWVWRAGAGVTDKALGTVSLAAAALLTSPGLARLRGCAGCGWFFLDTSRNHSRRWCSMAFCGNRMKSRRQQQRRLQAGQIDMR